MAGAARPLMQRALPVVLPATSIACFGYAGYQCRQAWMGAEASPEAQLRAQWDRDAEALDRRRVAWATGPASLKPEAYRAKVIGEVHKMEALGPAGVKLAMNDAVAVLEEGVGDNLGFNIVKSPAGTVGIYPKAYLQPLPQAAGSNSAAC
eukprot:gnl/TRDRNA2_/TRDRNA2_63419_c0_seq1.p1 gnl/TRDRNA2_/TRDRNA2_63419_c0~~gnl/TRDRNA2_/TRDRNA2_63419_c0_seq1.p1  ORF type:complete len:162 (-),score=31.43 gnl/TRDRNA2_/TRDRNA2_63419_c0_seq1:69-518(-)